ncbi:MAG: hypothetical protein LBF89_05640 [Bacteroidales bacterium]|jgi:hypothetical protein|nr:hypothetical protein [Bacteroidales bacterium]
MKDFVCRCLARKWEMLVCSIVFLSLGVAVSAQPESDSIRIVKVSDKRRAILFVAGIYQMRNTYVNPLTGWGIPVGLYVPCERYFRKGVMNYEIRFNAGIPLSGVNPTVFVEAGYSHYYHFRLFTSAGKRFFAYAGGGLTVDIDTDYNIGAIGNNSVSVTGRTDLQPSVMLKYRFTLFRKKRAFEITQQLSFPVAGYAFLPKYGYMAYQSFSDDDEKKKIEIGTLSTSLHNAWGLSARTCIDWRWRQREHRKGSYLRVGYAFDACRINYETRHQKAAHQLMVGMVRKF